MFERVVADGVAVHTVPDLAAESGVRLAFSERVGGVSAGPFATLNLAAHVGDDPRSVDENRTRLLEALGVGALRDRLTTAEQVHATTIVEVTDESAGAGAWAAGGSSPVAGADALWTRAREVPLLLLFADCVPVVLVRPSVPAIAVVHAGWRGAAAGIAGMTARLLASLGGDDDCQAFIGPHIGGCCYTVGPEVHAAFTSVSQSCTTSDTLSQVPRPLDLARAVTADLARSGVPEERQWHLGICTAHSTHSFYSYRAEGLTGRHGALAVIF